MSYVQKPYTEAEMQERVSGVREAVAKKLNQWADRIQVSMAHTPSIPRVEGETWSEDGKTYVMKDGFKQSISIMQQIRMPWHCPKCSKSMNHRFDRKFFYLRGWCYNCNVEWEGQLRVEGKWEAFEKRMLRENEKSFIRDKIQELSEYIRTFTVPTAYYEDGRFEHLANIEDFEPIFLQLEADIEFLFARLAVIHNEENSEEQPDDSTTQVGEV